MPVTLGRALQTETLRTLAPVVVADDGQGGAVHAGEGVRARSSPCAR